MKKLLYSFMGFTTIIGTCFNVVSCWTNPGGPTSPNYEKKELGKEELIKTEDFNLGLTNLRIRVLSDEKIVFFADWRLFDVVQNSSFSIDYSDFGLYLLYEDSGSRREEFYVSKSLTDSENEFLISGTQTEFFTMVFYSFDWPYYFESIEVFFLLNNHRYTYTYNEEELTSQLKNK
ncbi:hypothetical protein SCHIN_v1c08420 [Spiroplasma chinense]|uniref:Uncharacterized protein n=1 Tax=Spiroplasma chinense TaxID=216932 RepID=A0A5B9Y6Y1_9MOLU|nr:hypothetical protein [Spiroplasma chinense]QEH62037.1 hypothetical protein SCHIN_v1c08420 [Spiroplasma chinense]